jgi:hypothetical protein
MDPAIIKAKRLHLRDSIGNKSENKQWRLVTSADTMLLEGIQKKENIAKNVTDKDILDEVNISIEERVTPYFHLPYQDQLAKKKEWLTKEVLCKYTSDFERQIKMNKEYPPSWYRDVHLKVKDEGIVVPVCHLEKIIECDQDYIPGYRNKVEFTIGREFGGLPLNENKGEICVGFNQGNMSKGIMFVGKPDKVKVISELSKQVAKKLENIIVKFNTKY